MLEDAERERCDHAGNTDRPSVSPPSNHTLAISSILWSTAESQSNLWGLDSGMSDEKRPARQAAACKAAAANHSVLGNECAAAQIWNKTVCEAKLVFRMDATGKAPRAW